MFFSSVRERASSRICVAAATSACACLIMMLLLQCRLLFFCVLASSYSTPRKRHLATRPTLFFQALASGCRQFHPYHVNGAYFLPSSVHDELVKLFLCIWCFDTVGVGGLEAGRCRHLARLPAHALLEAWSQALSFAFFRHGGVGCWLWRCCIAV